MEQCLRIALWMVVLTGCLQAKPVTPGPDATTTRWSFKKIHFGLLRDVNEVDCRQSNATFPSLRGMDMTADCVEALACCIEGLNDAKLHCTNKNERIEDTLDDLIKGSENMSLPECKRPKTSKFEDFYEDSRFYAPTNVKTHCITDALGCMRRELNGTAKIECEDFNQYIDDSVDSLGLLIAKRSKKDLGLTNSNECACEGYEEKPFVEFVKALESLLQRVYSS
ncbi:hypothetical protein JOQ06_023485 [Pogonophryne albipinna]|uniref:Interleukin n=1 Tax=Pogonophryne albipinna TaxID=1090488 RepID=A0AAD6BN26_9TELE|nr:hypothetical protein JOQ06_023485 [Pogonophryne albipinna]